LKVANVPVTVFVTGWYCPLFYLQCFDTVGLASGWAFTL